VLHAITSVISVLLVVLLVYLFCIEMDLIWLSQKSELERNSVRAYLDL